MPCPPQGTEGIASRSASAVGSTLTVVSVAAARRFIDGRLEVCSRLTTRCPRAASLTSSRLEGRRAAITSRSPGRAWALTARASRRGSGSRSRRAWLTR